MGKKGTTMTRLLELAAQARQMQTAGQERAELAIVGEVLTPEDRAAIQQLAQSGNEEAARELEQLDGAEIAIFTDPFARNAYLRKQVELLAKEDSPGLDEVIARLFALQAQTMPGKHGKMLPAIPLLVTHARERDAKKQLCGEQPIVLVKASRKNRGRKDEHIDARIEQYLAPATVVDRQTFRLFKLVLTKAAEVLITRLDNAEKMNLRQVVWYAVHLVPQSQVVSPKWADRILEKRADGTFERRDTRQSYLRFELSTHEIYIVPKNDRTERLMEQLKALAES